MDELSRTTEFSNKDAEVILNEILAQIVSALNRGEEIELRGFGSFPVKSRPARRGRNPKTCEPVDIPAKQAPFFKPGKEMKWFFEAPSELVDYSFRGIATGSIVFLQCKAF